MFKLNVEVIKSYEKSNGKLVVEGVASDPTIDRDEERFDVEAIKKMLDGVNNGQLPIRSEHEDKFYTDIGIWKEARLDDKDRFHVKGEIDTELSLGKDIAILLKRGAGIGLSVGGAVIDAIYEYSKELGRSIKVYKDVVLQEISIVKNPANLSTSLSLSKSIDWNKIQKFNKTTDMTVPYSSQAQKLIKFYKEYEKKTLTAKEMDKGQTEKKQSKKKGSYSKWFKEIEPKVDDVLKDVGPVDTCCSMESQGLSVEDLQLVAQLVTVMSSVDLPEDGEVPEVLSDPEYSSNLVEEQMIVLWCREMVMPHHRKDLVLDKELVLYQMKKAVDFRSYYTPKDYTVIMAHLFRHLKELDLLKKGFITQESLVQKKKADKIKIDKENLDMLQKAHAYINGTSKDKPLDMNDAEIHNCAAAYEKLLKSPSSYYIFN
jgi:phage head maturation protease